MWFKFPVGCWGGDFFTKSDGYLRLNAPVFTSLPRWGRIFEVHSFTKVFGNPCLVIELETPFPKNKTSVYSIFKLRGWHRMTVPLSLFSLGLNLMWLIFPKLERYSWTRKALPTLNFILLHSMATQNSKIGNKKIFYCSLPPPHPPKKAVLVF